ncbi:MAG: hypothetical protein IPM06_18895 [Rhizobiales bacterium]|nr:hypothetical protein [Hyphomicrobiales bacterium]
MTFALAGLQQAWGTQTQETATPTDSGQGESGSTDLISLLPQSTRTALLADKDYQSKIAPGSYREQMNLNMGDQFDSSSLSDPDKWWVGSMGTKRVFQSDEFSDTDRWAPGAMQAALKNATYDPRYGILYDVKDVDPYWIPEEVSLMDKLIPGLIVGAATGGIGSGIGAAIGSGVAGQAIASGASSAMQGGSGKDILVSAAAGGLGSAAGGATGKATADALKGSVSTSLATQLGKGAGAAVGAGTASAIRAVGGGGSFADVLQSALWSAGAAGAGSAVNAGVSEVAGSETAGKIAGSVTSGLINSAKPTQESQNSQSITQNAETTTTSASGKKPVSVSDLSWGWLSPAR